VARLQPRRCTAIAAGAGWGSRGSTNGCWRCALPAVRLPRRPAATRDVTRLRPDDECRIVCPPAATHRSPRASRPMAAVEGAGAAAAIDGLLAIGKRARPHVALGLAVLVPVLGRHAGEVAAAGPLVVRDLVLDGAEFARDGGLCSIRRRGCGGLTSSGLCGTRGYLCCCRGCGRVRGPGAAPGCGRRSGCVAVDWPLLAPRQHGLLARCHHRRGQQGQDNDPKTRCRFHVGGFRICTRCAPSVCQWRQGRRRVSHNKTRTTTKHHDASSRSAAQPHWWALFSSRCPRPPAVMLPIQSLIEGEHAPVGSPACGRCGCGSARRSGRLTPPLCSASLCPLQNVARWLIRLPPRCVRVASALGHARSAPRSLR